MRGRRLSVCVALLLGFLLAAAAAGGCRGRARAEIPVRPDPDHPGRFRADFEAMGTDATLMVCAEDAQTARAIIAPALERVRRVERLMSVYLPDSEVSRLNAAGASHAVVLSPETLEVLAAAKRLSELTGGAFDVTYAPLRALWREAQMRDVVPLEEELRRAMLSVGHEKLVLSGNSAMFAAPGMSVDLGGIAKGYGVDAAAEALRRAGAASALVDIGGDMRLVGKAEGGRKWRIRVRDPRGAGERPIVLELADAAVATSGDYARYFTVAGRRYSHIIDPRTGWPVTDVPSATVVAPDATTADALATAISVMGAEKGIELIDSMPGVECLVMTRGGGGGGSAAGVRLHMSSGFSRLMQ